MNATNAQLDQNKALVRRFVKEVFEDCRPEAIDELVADDFVSHTWPSTGDPKADLKAAAERMGHALKDRRFEVDDLIAEGDRVVARVTAHGTASADFTGITGSAGRSYTISEIHIFRLRDGKVVEHWHQYDALGMRRQLSGEPESAT